MPTTLEACRLLMLALVIAAIPLALLIEWLRPLPSLRFWKRMPENQPTTVLPATKKGRFVVRITPRIKGIH